ncbi:MAG: M28 family peptidase [Verrucomicrobiae bacterium]|nr:M28 family peptidase [Verrucomicrobiae bacterium]
MAAPLILTVFVAVCCIGCARRSPREIDWRGFDGQRAFAHVERIVSFGPRPSGSTALGNVANYISTRLREYGLDVEEQVFVAPTPRGPLQFRNVIGKTRCKGQSHGGIIVIASHYDTKYLPAIHFVGANDGGSSSGVLLELARLTPAIPDLWFVFFDGEECINEYSPNDGLWGSTHFVNELKNREKLNRIQAMILLDMIGDRDLHVTIPANSHPALVQRVFDSAKATGHRRYFSFTPIGIIDDHVPFAMAGVPAVNLIDFQFGSAPGLNDYWHTEQDTLDKISPRSLEIVGQTVLHLLCSLRREPKL